MNTVHLHLMLTHVPVLATAFALAALAAGLWKRDESVKRFAFGVLVVSALIAIPVYLTGEPSEDVAETLAGVSKASIEQHEEAAGVALGGTLGLGAIALIGLALFRGMRAVPRWFATSTLFATLFVSAIMMWTANLGGKIRHTEIQSSAASHVRAGDRD